MAAYAEMRDFCFGTALALSSEHQSRKAESEETIMQRISTDKARSADITVGFKTEQKYAEWVHRAAAKAGMSASAYQRKVTLEWAAADLGISSAEVAAALAPRPPSQQLVKEAAKASGMSPQQFTRAAVHELARTILAQAAARAEGGNAPARSQSQTRLRRAV